MDMLPDYRARVGKATISSPLELATLPYGEVDFSEILAAGCVLPSKLSLRRKMTGVRDQSERGACTSFAVIACAEYFYEKDLSEANLVTVSERNNGDCVEGLSPLRAFRAMCDFGVVEERFWNYDPNLYCWPNPPNIDNFPRYKLAQIGQLHPTHQEGFSVIDRIRLLLACSDNVALISIAVYDNADWHFGATGNIVMPPDQSIRHVVGMHCVVVTGYDDEQSRFEFKNSWSADWGAGGYGTLPYQYVYLLCNEVWCCSTQPNLIPVKKDALRLTSSPWLPQVVGTKEAI